MFWSILWPFGLFYGRGVYFVAVGYILWLLCTFFPFWYVVLIEIWQPCAECASIVATLLKSAGKVGQLMSRDPDNTAWCLPWVKP
jgi:hypothetical protein